MTLLFSSPPRSSFTTQSQRDALSMWTEMFSAASFASLTSALNAGELLTSCSLSSAESVTDGWHTVAVREIVPSDMILLILFRPVFISARESMTAAARSMMTAGAYGWMSENRMTKAAIVGDTGAGKTCLCRALKGMEFDTSTEPTMGAGIFYLKFEYETVVLWDTAGQERFQAITPIYMRGANTLLVAFSEDKWTDDGARDVLVDWISRAVLPNCVEGCDIALVLTKADTLIGGQAAEYSEQMLHYDTFRKWERKGHSVMMFTTSAKTGSGVEGLAEWMRERATEWLQSEGDEKTRRVEERKKKGACC